jgi:polysaccharide export outer membrane protein
MSVLLWLFAGILILNACTTATPVQPAQPAGNSQSSNGEAQQISDLKRLANLWQSRNQNRSTGDYPVGAGDLLVINVAGLEELHDRTVRVSPTGTISLPFVGLINVTGMSESALADDIRKRLQKNIMRDPQVTLLAKETLSRQVAVVGAVQKPGLYNLAGSSDTILGMISQAGGMKPEAAERILFIPAEPASADKAKEVIAALPARIDKAASPPLVLKDVDPIVIALDRINRSNSELYLNMPARPGDVLMVPGSGDVLIQGWVEKPGTYKISSVLTLLGAIAAAGGTSFAADSNSVEVIRTNNQGQKTTLVTNLDAIRKGTEPDVALREGDIIDVGSSSPRLVAWGFYRVFTSLVHVGASIPIR